MTATIAGAAGIYAGGLMTNSLAAEPQAPLPEEDGYNYFLLL